MRRPGRPLRGLVAVLAPALALALALGAAGRAVHAEAQSVRYRRPYEVGHRLNYGFDHDGGGGGCSDYACSGACYDGHSGSDFGAPFGTTVLAAAEGRVSATHDGCADYGGLGNTCGGRCGNHVQIQHDDGSYSIYCHMRRGSLRVGTGARVSCGQVLGESASSGNSTGPHLHFGHRSPGSSASSDPFAGRCGRSTSLWRGQGDYREAPSTSCGCTPSAESCNGRDDDCDGRVDEDLSRGCSTACGAGRETCSGGAWRACDAPRPSDEVCNGRDDDCDGTVDEDVCDRMEAAPGALPDALDLGQASGVGLELRNVGTTTWRPGRGYGIHLDFAGVTVISRGALDAAVPPGGIVSLELSLRPQDEGAARVSVAVTRDGRELEGAWVWEVPVRRPVFGARFVDLSLPATLAPGERAGGWALVANEGREPWPATALVATREGAAGGRITGAATGVVEPGAEIRVALVVEAPADSRNSDLVRTLVVRDASGEEATWPEPTRPVRIALGRAPSPGPAPEAGGRDPEAPAATLGGGCAVGAPVARRSAPVGWLAALALLVGLALRRARARRGSARLRGRDEEQRAHLVVGVLSRDDQAPARADVPGAGELERLPGT